MSKYDKIKPTKFSGKYVNGRAEDALKDFSKNSNIIKGSTGIGGTHSILNNTKGNCIIISPNVGMIKKKSEGKYHSHKQLFIYSKSPDNWNDALIYTDEIDFDSQNLVINTTAEQMLKIKSKHPELFEKLKSINVFVDEIHAFAQDSSFRKSLGEFMELVYNQWEATFKTSTATPVFKGIDIPENLNIQYHKLERENEPKKLVWISKTYSDYKDFVYSEHHKGRKVVVFSNNVNIHNDFRDLRVLNLVGKNLKIKLAPYGRGQLVKDWSQEDYDVIILSSSYFAGYDLEFDCSVCVVSEQRIEAYKINIMNFVQAFGRCREKVHNSLYINVTAKKDRKGKKITFPKTKMEVDDIQRAYHQKLKYYQSVFQGEYVYDKDIDMDYITKDYYPNRLLLLHQSLGRINDYLQYNENLFIETLESYNFIPQSYESNDEKFAANKRIVFKDRISNLSKLSSDDLFNGYSDIKRGLKYKDEGSFTYEIALAYLTVYLLKTSGVNIILDKLSRNKKLKPCEFYHSVDLFLRANVDTQYYYHQLSVKEAEYGEKNYKDELVGLKLRGYGNYTDNWQFLYAINCYKKQGFDPTIERVLDIYEQAHKLETYKAFIDDKKHREDKAKRVILRALKELKIILNSDEKQWLKERCKSIYKSLDKDKEIHSYSHKYTINLLIDSLGYLLVEGKGNHKSKIIKNREYYPLIHLPREMRWLIPIKYLSIDLDSANPQIVDSIIGSQIGLEVYGNLMKSRGITRMEAKKLYNTYLNRHYLSFRVGVEFYLECGYTQDESEKLAKLTTNVKRGEFYERMTENEQILMENYNHILMTSSHRFHDALIVKMESVESCHIGLPYLVGGYKYHFNIFNDGSLYDGLILN